MSTLLRAVTDDANELTTMSRRKTDQRTDRPTPGRRCLAAWRSTAGCASWLRYRAVGKNLGP